MLWLEDSFEFLVAHPIVLIGLALLPLILLAAVRSLFPTRRLLVAAVIPTAISLTTAITGEFLGFVVIIDALLLFLFAIDLFLVPPKSTFATSRSMERIMSLGKPSTVELELINKSNRRHQLELVDDCPEDFVAIPAKFAFVCDPKSRTKFTYRLRSKRRGLFQLLTIYLRVASRFGYWHAYYQYREPFDVNVYPDLKQISEYGVLARTNRLSLLGVRQTRRVGQDNEFERLRDYTRDDNHRHIDWRATARKRKLMVRDFQVNQNQNLIFMIDCGRMMTGQSGRITLLDHALNAMLLMSFVALKQGDSVGMLTFSDRIHSYTPPKSGGKQINRLLHNSFNQHAGYVESRFDEAFFYLKRNCRKRSLVVLITNLIDEINTTQVTNYLKNLTGHHLPMGVFLRDRELFAPVDEYLVNDSPNPRELFTAAAAADIIRWRNQSIVSLTHSGVLCVDCFPEQLTSTLVNRYLDIKARHLL
jgi:uncharacterized protein (DUF58 family)